MKTHPHPPSMSELLTCGTQLHLNQMKIQTPDQLQSENEISIHDNYYAVFISSFIILFCHHLYFHIIISSEKFVCRSVLPGA